MTSVMETLLVSEPGSCEKARTKSSFFPRWSFSLSSYYNRFRCLDVVFLQVSIIVSCCFATILIFSALDPRKAAHHFSMFNQWLFNIGVHPTSHMLVGKLAINVLLGLSVTLGLMLGAFQQASSGMLRILHRAELYKAQNKFPIEDATIWAANGECHSGYVRQWIVNLQSCVSGRFITLYLIAMAEIFGIVYISSILGDQVAILSSTISEELRRPLISCVCFTAVSFLFLVDTFCVLPSLISFTRGLEISSGSNKGEYKSIEEVCQICCKNIRPGHIRLVAPSVKLECEDHPFHLGCYLSKVENRDSCPVCEKALAVTVEDVSHSMFAKLYFTVIAVLGWVVRRERD